MAEETQVQEVPLDQTPTIAEYKARQAAEKAKVPEEPKTETPPDKQDDEGNEEVEPKEDKTVSASEEKPKGKGGFQKRIDRLIKQVAAAEETAATERKKREELEAKGATKQEPVAEEGEPNREDYTSDADFIKASVKYGLAQARIEDAKDQARQDAEKHQTELNKKYNEAVIEAKSRFDDWDEVVGQDMALPLTAGPAMLRVPNGPDVAYHIGKNPEIAEELWKLDPYEVTLKIWEFSRELEGAKPKPKSEASGEGEEKPKKPKPITPVGSSGNGHTTVPLDKMDIASYKKARSTGRVQ